MSQNEITTEDTGKTYIVRLPSIVDDTFKNKMESSLSNWLLSRAHVYILDLTNVATLQKSTYPIFTQLSQVLKKNGKRVFSFGVSDKLKKQISHDGVDKVFNTHSTLNEVLLQAGLRTQNASKLDANFINPFLLSTVEVLSTQAKLNVKPGKPYTSKSPTENKIEIAAILTVNSPKFCCTISIEFPKEVYLKFYEKMLQEKHSAINDENKDAVGEMLNMIYGQIKTKLNKAGYQLDLAIPKVFTGDNLKERHKDSTSALVIPMNSEAGEFFLQINLSEK